MATLDGTGILSGTGILDGRGMLFQSGIIVPPLVSLDPDAAAYIALVEAAGAAPDAAQKTVISDFYVAAKAEGYYTSLKRLYLPIWEVAAANAIDMITGASGTWSGSVTHAAGYVQSDGSTGYFTLGTTDAIFTDAASLHLGVLVTQKNSGAFQRYIANLASSTSTFALMSPGGPGDITYRALGDATETAASAAAYSSAIFAGDWNGTTRTVYAHRAGVTTTLITNTVASTGTLGTTNMFSVATTAKYGAVYASLSLTPAEVSVYLNDLETLWESCTGLTL